MSDTKTTPWTPGPWTKYHHSPAAVQLMGGAFIANHETGRLVARLHDVGGERDEPNARLIAAAPEMAELLEQIARHYDSVSSGKTSWTGQAHALLSLIRGDG